MRGQELELLPDGDPLGAEVARLAQSRGVATTRPLPAVVADSWKRCLADHRLLPDRVPRAAVLTQAEIRDLSGTYEELLAVAAPEVEKLFLRLADSAYLVSLASPEGAMMLFRCDHRLLGEMAGRGVLPGSVWTEDQQGTNGVGTCLQIGKPVTIDRGQHYGVDVQSLTCLTAPISGRHGAVESVLNVTTPRAGDERTNRLVQDIVERAARRIENRYFNRVNREAIIVRLSGDRDYADLADEARLAVDADGRIVAGTSHLGALIGRPAEDIIGLPAEELLDLDRDLSHARPDYPLPFHIRDRLVYASIRSRPSRAARGSVRSVGLPVADRSLPMIEAGRDAALALADAEVDALTAMALDRACKLLAAGLPIVVSGESGTGRTTLAHMAARRSFGAACAIFVLDCAGASGVDVASAAAQMVSAPRPATLVLDRLDELDEPGQAALLAVLESRGCARIGLIAVSTEDLDGLVRDGRMRSDLVHRVNGGTVELLPLRSRPDMTDTIEKIVQIERTALGKNGLKLGEDARRVLENHYWPGNLRELRYAVRHAAALADRGTIELDHLPSGIVSQIAGKDLSVRSQAEASRIEAALRFNGGNVSRTARHLGVSRATLYRKIQIGMVREQV